MEEVVINLIMQNKGGLGKSHISWLLANFLMKQDNNLKVYDNDSQVPVIMGYKSLNAEHIQLFQLDDQGNVKAESLNINKLNPIAHNLESGEHKNILVDCGSPSYQPTLSFFQAGAVELYRELGVKFRIFLPVAKDSVTHSALLEVLAAYGDLAEYVIIENEFFREFNYNDSVFKKAGVKYAKMKLTTYTKAQEEDIGTAKENGLLLDEAIKDPIFSLVQKSRLMQARKDFENVISQIIADFEEQ